MFQGNSQGIALLVKNNAMTVPRRRKFRSKWDPKTRKLVINMQDAICGEDVHG
jgi:hypothetical protein